MEKIMSSLGKNRELIKYSLQFKKFCKILEKKDNNKSVIVLIPNVFESGFNFLKSDLSNLNANSIKEGYGYIYTVDNSTLKDDILFYFNYWSEKIYLYENIFSLFKNEAKKIRTGQQLNLSSCLHKYKGSILIDQDKNQKNKDKFYLYINFDNKEITEIFSSEDIFKFILDIYYEDNIDEFKKIFDILYRKEELIFDSFLCNKNYKKIIKDALFYRYIGLVENKIDRTETQVIEKLLKELNYIVKIDDKGNIIYEKDI